MSIVSPDAFSFFTYLPVVAYRCEQKGIDRQFHAISPYVHALLGMPPESFRADPKAFFLRIHPEDRNLFLRAWEHHQKIPAVINLEYRMLTADNRTIWVKEHSVMTLGEKEHVKECHGILVEISNFQEIKDELERWDRELQSLTRHLPDIVARIDHKKRLLYLNRWWDHADPLPPEMYLGKSLVDLGLSLNVAKIFEDKINRVFETGYHDVFEISHPTAQGMKVFEVRFFPETSQEGHRLTVLLVCRDVTDTRTAQLAFKESDEKFHQLAEHVDSVFWIWDVSLQQMVYVSPAYQRLWGGDPDRLMNNPFDWLTVVVPEDRRKVEEQFLKRMSRESVDLEFRVVGHDHEVRWVHNRTFPIQEASGATHRVFGVALDVTERKKWEEERLRGAKLESLGLLAGGLAHDFNNLLTAILGQLSLAKHVMDTSDPLYERISEAEHASLRAQDIALQLLTFSKGGAPVKNTINLNKPLEENVRLVLAGSPVRPVFEIASDLWPVHVDIGQVCQVVHNLVINARQAMESGGELIIRARNMPSNDSRIWELSESSSSQDFWVAIEFVDQGGGIRTEILEKIFDPYFTTKSAGSGLGLATSHSIIRNHGGRLSVESTMGVGSTFTVVLPAVPFEEISDEPVEHTLQVGQGRILIMDDEIQIRKILGEMVERCGYSYQTAKDGEEALDIFCQAKDIGQPFAAVILDLTIPGGLGGKEVIDRLLSLDPHVRAIVVSGYSNDPVLANYQEYGFKGRVAKPFNLVDISKVLSRVVQDASTS